MTQQKQFSSRKDIQERANGIQYLPSMLIIGMSQIAATEEQMRSEGKIDKDGHLKNGKSVKKTKTQASE